MRKITFKEKAISFYMYLGFDVIPSRCTRYTVMKKSPNDVTMDLEKQKLYERCFKDFFETSFSHVEEKDVKIFFGRSGAVRMGVTSSSSINIKEVVIGSILNFWYNNKKKEEGVY